MLVQNGTTEFPNQIDFGLINNIPSGSGLYYEIENPRFSTIGFHINPPNDGWVQYQGSFDGINYSNITFRQVGADGYTQEADGIEDYIGSVIGLKRIRFVNATGSMASGTVIGTLSKEVSTLEGIEHSSPPHKFGNGLFHIGFNISGSAVSNSGLYFPPARHRFVVTYISFGVAAQNGSYVTFHEGSGTASDPSKWIYSIYVQAPLNNAQIVNAGINTPYVASALLSGLYLTTDGTATIRGIVHGYKSE